MPLLMDSDVGDTGGASDSGEARPKKPSSGDLLPQLYPELKRIAAHHMDREGPAHTLQPTALVHEVFVRLAAQGDAEVNDRTHFMRLASGVMRRVLVDHARGKKRVKRGSGWSRVAMIELPSGEMCDAVDILDLEDALVELEKQNERAAKLVELRFFGGLTEDEAAEALGVARSTAAAEWKSARGWLAKVMGNDPT